MVKLGRILIVFNVNITFHCICTIWLNLAAAFCGELLIVRHTFVFRVSESGASANKQKIDYLNSAL